MKEEVLLQCFKGLNDATRLKIVGMLKDGEWCACDLLEHLNISQSTLSHHMKLLSDCGLIEVRKESKWAYYTINKETMVELERYFQSFASIVERRREC